MTKVTYFDSEVNNTEDYGTLVKINTCIKLEDHDTHYLLTVTHNGCLIKEVD